jgi:hypothetical protein
MWETMAKNVIHVAKETLRMSSGKIGVHKESWWWNEDVQVKVRFKQECFRELLRCSDEEERVRSKERYKEPNEEQRTQCLKQRTLPMTSCISAWSLRKERASCLRLLTLMSPPM